MKPIEDTSPHRLFTAIVLMGTGLVAGCGGIAESERSTGAGNGPNATSTGGTSTAPASGAGGGVRVDVGGATSTSAGGTSNAGAAPVPTTGGSTPGRETVDPSTFACPPEQWSCASETCDNSTFDWVLPDFCGCDPARPLKQSDCEAGEVFTCQNATSTSDGRRLSRPVALACRCMPQTMRSCNEGCGLAYGKFDVTCSGGPDELSALCGCAVIYLK